MTAARVVAKGWGWRYAGRRLPAVRDVSFAIEPGERVLLLGASGAGKSTLMTGMAGLLGDAEEGESQGSLRVDGEDPQRHRGRIGLVLQDPDAGVVLSKVGDDVAFGCENLGVPAEEITGRVREALDAVGLDVPLDRPTAALSGGQKQRLALAGALAMRPGLLLLDEPTANLDPVGVREIRASVERAVESTGATLVVIEHRTQIWADLMTRVIVVGADGGLLADGAPAEVFGCHGDALADAGVWVPGHPVDLPVLPVLGSLSEDERSETETKRGDPVGNCVSSRGSSVAARSTTSGGEALLATRDLAITRDRRRAVQSGLGFAVPDAAATVITGPNGSGKSTLALTLAGLLAPLRGEVIAAGRLSGRRGLRPDRWSSRELLTRIGMVFQDPEHQFLTQTVRDELTVGPRALGWERSRIDAVVDALLERLDLSALAAANPFTLSGGQKRRLSVATVLAAAPAVIVLDEPTFGQDRRGWIGIVALLQEEIARGTTVIAVTHDEDVICHLGGQRIALPGSAA